MSAFDLVVFDIDDTLYLERDYVRSGFAAVQQAAVGRVPDDFARRAWREFEAGRRGDVFDRVLADRSNDAQLVRELVELYRNHVPAIELLPDAREAMERATERSWVGVVTDGPGASQRAKATALGLDARTRAIVFTEELGRGFGKPHPRAFMELERVSGVSGDRAVYVADNPAKDFGGPRSLGWRTIRVRRSASLHAAIDSGDDVDDEVVDLTDFAARLVS